MIKKNIIYKNKTELCFTMTINLNETSMLRHIGSDFFPDYCYQVDLFQAQTTINKELIAI